MTAHTPVSHARYAQPITAASPCCHGGGRPLRFRDRSSKLRGARTLQRQTGSPATWPASPTPPPPARSCRVPPLVPYGVPVSGVGAASGDHLAHLHVRQHEPEDADGQAHGDPAGGQQDNDQRQRPEPDLQRDELRPRAASRWARAASDGNWWYYGIRKATCKAPIQLRMSLFHSAVPGVGSGVYACRNLPELLGMGTWSEHLHVAGIMRLLGGLAREGRGVSVPGLIDPPSTVRPPRSALLHAATRGPGRARQRAAQDVLS